MKHPFVKLYTLEERRIVEWPEQPIPKKIPEAIRKQAIPGVKVHPFFEGREVWFWERDSFTALLDYLEQHNQRRPNDERVWIEEYRFFGKSADGYDLLDDFGGGWSSPGSGYEFLSCREFVEDDRPEVRNGLAWVCFSTGQ